MKNQTFSTTVLSALLTAGAFTSQTWSCPPDIADSGGACGQPDGVVGSGDLLCLMGQMGPCPGCIADFNGDDIVDLVDFAYLAENWGPCPAAHPGTAELFAEIVVVDATTPSADSMGLLVTHLYATGANVGLLDSLLLAHDASIVADGGTFFFDSACTNNGTPPSASCINFFPESAYNTFVTMAELVEHSLLTDNLNVTNVLIEGSWFKADLGVERDAVDISALTGNPGQYGVRIAQITIDKNVSTQSVGYSGSVRLYTSSFDNGSLNGVDVPVNFAHSPSTGTCLADLNHDGVVNQFDMLEVLGNFGSCPPPPAACPGDFNGDGVINVVDLMYVFDSWGTCPHPEPGAIELFDRILTVCVTDADAHALGLTVSHVFATGDNVGPGDALLFVHETDINVVGNSVIHEAPLLDPACIGSGGPPTSACVSVQPEFKYDTFLTMREVEDYNPHLLTSNISSTSVVGSWAGFDETTGPHPERNAIDISSITGNPGEYGVLIAQITLEKGHPNLCYSGSTRLYTSPHSGGSLQGVDVDLFFRIRGDINCDGIVNVFDLLELLAAWGDCADCSSCPADLDGSCAVNVFDLLLLLSNWG